MSGATKEERAADVRRQLERVIDPELGMSVVRLGLIYDVRIDEDAVEVDMTLTSRGCPLERAITAGVHRVVSELPWVRAVVVRVVWDPPWNPEMIQKGNHAA